MAYRSFFNNAIRFELIGAATVFNWCWTPPANFLIPPSRRIIPKAASGGIWKRARRRWWFRLPLKLKIKACPCLKMSVTTVMGINGNDFDPRRHRIVSNASCTTNCLAHMIKPLLNVFGAKRVLSASMATIHAATGSQQVLDRLPGDGKIFPMKYFFTTGFSMGTGTANDISSLTVKDAIQKMIKEENPATPLKDQQIVDLLKERGIDIARRTVAKYREELRIPPTSVRKRTGN